MDISQALRTDGTCVNAILAGKEEALRAVVRNARRCSALQNLSEDALLAALEEREALGSTGFGGGIAIPHCRLSSLDEFVVGLITVPDGVAFDAADGEPVRIIVYIIAPDRQTNEHVRMLAAVSNVLSQPGSTDELIASPTPEAAVESFLRRVHDDVSDEYADRSLFHVFVRDEEEFHQILRVFAAVRSASTVVTEAKSLQSFLGRMPLFAGLWGDEPGWTCRVIVAVVERKMTNEVLRRIEHMTGKLSERRDVLVTIQDVFFSAGAVEA